MAQASPRYARAQTISFTDPRVKARIEDVARRAATESFLALAPDGLSPVGGYPGNDDDGRALQVGLDQVKLRTDVLNSARYLKAHQLSTASSGFSAGVAAQRTTSL
jgi:carboxymethylenebutenolidase